MRAKERDINNDTVIVYWSPGRFILEEESWNMLYSEPESVIRTLLSDTIADSEIKKCPGVRSALKNVFSINSTHEENIIFNPGYLQAINSSQEDSFALDIPSKLQIMKQRQSDYPQRVSLTYNMSWYFFASEPVEAKMTSPYYPPTSPTPSAMLFPGEFNIGQWYRPFNLEYSIPEDSESFVIKEGDPLFYLEIKTNKKVLFKRYNNNRRLESISGEFVNSPKMFGSNKTLLDRYRLAKKTQLADIVLNEIINNVV
jgi:hypothetical protein